MCNTDHIKAYFFSGERIKNNDKVRGPYDDVILISQSWLSAMSEKWTGSYPT